MSNWEYIIGENIKFSPAMESLNLIKTPEISILLTPACSRLLQYLLSEQGIVVSRDAIFLKLWSQYGNTPSNSSLNTYISLIRKSFLNLGEEDKVIITIPKTGFLFNPDLKVKAVQIFIVEPNEGRGNVGCFMDNNMTIKNDSALENYDRTDGGPDYDFKFSKTKSSGNDIYRKLTSKNKGFYLYGFVTLCLATLIYSLVQNEILQEVTPVNIGKVDKCSIFFLPLHGEESIALPEGNIQYIIKKSNFTCHPGGVYYLYADKRVLTGKHGKTFVSYCELRDKSVKSCRDYIGINVKLPLSELH